MFKFVLYDALTVTSGVNKHKVSTHGWPQVFRVAPASGTLGSVEDTQSSSDYTAIRPSHLPSRGVVFRGPATSHHAVHTSSVAPLKSGTAPPMCEAVQHTQCNGGAHLLRLGIEDPAVYQDRSGRIPHTRCFVRRNTGRVAHTTQITRVLSSRNDCCFIGRSKQTLSRPTHHPCLHSELMQGH